MYENRQKWQQNARICEKCCCDQCYFQGWVGAALSFTLNEDTILSGLHPKELPYICDLFPPLRHFIGVAFVWQDFVIQPVHYSTSEAGEISILLMQLFISSP